MGLFGKTEEHQPDPVIEAVREKIRAAELPGRVKAVVDKEAEVLLRTSPAAAEYTIGLTYVEYLLSLPWALSTEDDLDLARAERVLDGDHYGLNRIKERVLEHLAVRRLKSNLAPRVLVVDDEEVARRNLAHILEREEYAVTTAANGVEALERLRSTEFDVILTDFKMEKVDGMEILERVKAGYPDTQVVMITGYATIDTAVEAMKKGAFHYLAKPFKIDDVRTTVRSALEKRQVRRAPSGSVLCFAGPPGTGKTSMGRSISKALGRRFARISLGGVKDEAEIRGHRRTYAGAMPGRIIEEIRRAGSSNPVMILDELDKIGGDLKGDPAAALLEALDPEQNSRFFDRYLDIPFDLSGVIFVVTANVADNIISPLRDRMEVIQFAGYTEEEKAVIASRFLVPRQVREAGLSEHPPLFADTALRTIIREYTHEAGIRNLQREIAAICRKIAREVVEKEAGAEIVTVDRDAARRFLGPGRYYFERAGDEDRVGVTTGMVWTEVGGEIIFVEAAMMKGKRELILTGSLGDVMRESARTALSFVRSNAANFAIDPDFFELRDIHIHVPAGAIPKDGPSAGTTIALALISLLTGRPARRNVAVSGELTLTGALLPVGGIKEKVLAAARARIKTVVLPLRNKVEVDGLLDEAPKDVEIRFAERFGDMVDEVLL